MHEESPLRNRLPIPAVVLVGAFVLAGIVYLIVPALRSAEAVVAENTAVEVEKTQRLLRKFSENEDRLAVLLAALNRAGVDTSISDGQIETMVNSENRDLLADEADRLGAIQDDLGDIIQTESFAEFSPNIPTMTTAIREGRKGRDAILAENDKLLADALTAVNGALDITHGAASSSDDAVPNRLKAMILYHHGVAAHRKAQLLRSQADTHRRALVELARSVQELGSDVALPAKSKIDQGIADAQSRGSTLRQERTAKQTEADQQQAAIDELVSRLELAQAAADQARTVMEQMDEQGLDLTDPEGFEKFKSAYIAHAETYRRAIRETREIEIGLTSDGEPRPGVIDRRHTLTHLQTELANLDELIEANAADVTKLEALKAQYAQRATSAQARIAKLRDSAKSEHAKLQDLLANAEAAEDDAISRLKQALSACTTASAAARERVSQAGMVTVSPDKLERLPASLIQEDGWIGASIGFQQASAHLRQAVVYFDRYREAADDVELLASIGPPLKLAEIDTAALAEKRDQAAEAGREAAQKADDLATRAGRDLQQHWTIPALVADARYLLMLFGDETLRDNVIDNYHVVVDGREDTPFVDAYENTLDMLERE